MANESLFSKHPASVGESYAQHLVSAMRFSLAMAVGSFVCCVHALLPFVFEKTGSRIVAHLHETMVRHRHRVSLQTHGTVDR